MATPTVRLQFDDLAPYLLLKNGNFLYKVPYQNGHAVIKVYVGSRGRWGRFTKSIANVWLYGQTSYFVGTRLRIERECMELWQSHGFRTFELYDHVTVDAPNCPEGAYLVMEYVARPKLFEILCDTSRSVEKRFEIYRRFLAEWSRRHELAIELQEPKLVHENGDGKHAMLMEDGSFLWFDFEMIYRSRRHTDRHVSHEIMQYIWQMLRKVPADIQAAFLEETVTHYPVPKRLEAAHDLFLRHPNLFMRMARGLDRRLTKRGKKLTSKYNVARKLRDVLRESGRCS